MSTDLKKIKIATSPLTGKIYIHRFGQHKELDKRQAEAEFFQALIEHMLFETAGGAVKTVKFGDQQYEITVKPCEKQEDD